MVSIREAFGVNPRKAGHRDLKLATDGARMRIASGLDPTFAQTRIGIYRDV